MLELPTTVNADGGVLLGFQNSSLTMSKSMLNDRRKETRVQVRFAAVLSWADKTGQEISEAAHTFSISNTGAGLIARQPFAVGQRVKVTMDVGGPSGFSWAEIKWVLPVENLFKVGLSFQA